MSKFLDFSAVCKINICRILILVITTDNRIYMDSQDFEKIIDGLTDTNKSISTPLLKIKVFAHRIQNQVMLDWVSKEIEGYEKGEDLPDYRKCRGYLIGTYLNGNINGIDQPIPKGRYLKDIDIEKIELRQGITSLESLLDTSDQGKGIGKEIRTDGIALIQQAIQEQDNPYFILASARVRISKTNIIDVVSRVRNNLLDLMLELDGKFADMQTIKKQSTEVSEIVTETIINAGAGCIINTGNNNSFVTNTIVNQGDKESLKKFLADNGVENKDIKDLLDVIDEGMEATNSWKEGMIEKAKSGLWQIKIGAAASLLADSIKAYLGM